MRRFDGEVGHECLDVPVKFDTNISAVGENDASLRRRFVRDGSEWHRLLVQLHLDGVASTYQSQQMLPVGLELIEILTPLRHIKNTSAAPLTDTFVRLLN